VTRAHQPGSEPIDIPETIPNRLWNPSQHLLRQNPPPRSQFGSRRGCPRTGTARVACRLLATQDPPSMAWCGPSSR
jgi:hypothetical protein